MNPVRGEQHGRSLLTEAEVRDIRALFATGAYTKVELADVYQVSPSCIRLVVLRRTWAHVTDEEEAPPR